MDFEYSLVQQYVSAINRSDISHVEVGFRDFPDKQYHGAFCYSNDDYVASFGFSSRITLYVMVDASTFSSVSNIRSSVEKLFQNPNKSPISGVRIAARLDELEISLQVIEYIRESGHTICLNSMQVATISAENLQNAIAKIEPGSIDTLYFADSLGEMNPIYVQKVAEVIIQK